MAHQLRRSVRVTGGPALHPREVADRQQRNMRLCRPNHGCTKKNYCVDYGPHRGEEYPGFKFCKECLAAEEYYCKHLVWPYHLKGETYKCTANHTFGGPPTDKIEGCYGTQYSKSKKVPPSSGTQAIILAVQDDTAPPPSPQMQFEDDMAAPPSPTMQVQDDGAAPPSPQMHSQVTRSGRA